MSENKKFKLSKNTKVVLGVTLFQIVALQDFADVSKGDKGGWLEKESNLSVYGDAWVYGNARVSGNASVYGDARVYGNASVYGDARVCGDARCEKHNTINYYNVYNLTVTDDHISYGCEQKTISEWKDWVNSSDVIVTSRDTQKFEAIRKGLEAAFILIESRNIKY